MSRFTLLALAVSAVGITATNAGAATVVSQAKAQAVNLSVLGGSTIALSNPATSATSDGTSSAVNSNTPAASLLSGQSFLSVGALSELASAYATGTSFGCAGVLQAGGALQVGAGGNCAATTGTGSGVTLNLSSLPGVGTLLNGIASVSIHLSAIVSYAEATGSSSIGSVAIANGDVNVAVAGGLLNVDVPINLSSAPNQNLLAEVIASLSAQHNVLLTTVINTLSNTLSPALQLVTNDQTTTAGTLKVIGLHVAVLGANGVTADLATAWAGPNTSGVTPPSAPPTVLGISPTSGPTTGGTFVTITGGNLNGTTGVTFGGTPATFVSNSDGSLTADSPAGTGTVDVQVTNPLGASPTTAADQFTYIPASSTGQTVPGSASASGTANAAGLCPAGEVPIGYIYSLPLTLKVTDTELTPGATVFSRIVEGNRIVVSTKTKLSSAHAATVTVKSTSDGTLTGELVYNKRVVKKVAVPLSTPSGCKAASAATGTMTYTSRITEFKVGSKLAGGIYLNNKLVQSFNVQVRANHMITFVDHTPQAGAVARIFKPGKAHTVLVTVKGVKS